MHARPAFLRQHELPELALSTELIVRECLNNAIHHGNRRDPRKRVRLLVEAEKGVVYVTVADEGQGFNWNSYTPARLPAHTRTDRARPGSDQQLRPAGNL